MRSRTASSYNASQSRPRDVLDSLLIEKKFWELYSKSTLSVKLRLIVPKSQVAKLLRQNLKRVRSSTALPWMSPACDIKIQLLATESVSNSSFFPVSSHNIMVSHKASRTSLTSSHPTDRYQNHRRPLISQQSFKYTAVQVKYTRLYFQGQALTRLRIWLRCAIKINDSSGGFSGATKELRTTDFSSGYILHHQTKKLIRSWPEEKIKLQQVHFTETRQTCSAQVDSFSNLCKNTLTLQNECVAYIESISDDPRHSIQSRWKASIVDYVLRF